MNIFEKIKEIIEEDGWETVTCEIGEDTLTKEQTLYIYIDNKLFRTVTGKTDMPTLGEVFQKTGVTSRTEFKGKHRSAYAWQ